MSMELSWNERYGFKNIEIRHAMFEIFKKCEAGEPHKKWSSTLRLLFDNLVHRFVHFNHITEERKLEEQIVEGIISYDEMRKKIDEMYERQKTEGNGYWLNENGEIEVINHYNKGLVAEIYRSSKNPIPD